ncbi:MAG: amino acid permease, partial [Gammaproteobacteria bacterium]|nr:amino acid permease [Gammaproteobacteria bacterium]
MNKFLRFFIGEPQDPTRRDVFRRIVLIAFFAWIGLGSDGLSSANYGPEEAFKALGVHNSLGVFLAIMIAATVFIIAAAYNQVVELFPNGGGGYKVANKLLHPYAGLVSGVALIVDYILTIAISISAASDALFSLLPYEYGRYNLFVKLLLVIVLTLLNLRGMKESIKIMMPIFLGFVLTHLCLIIYGFVSQAHHIPVLIQETQLHSELIIKVSGIGAFLMILCRAFALGGGTFTGLEAVSNNVNVLAEPRVRTAKWTMFYMALSLSLTAGGIILLYALWHIQGQPGQTYNAILFGSILGNSGWGSAALVITLSFEAGILLLGANTGFLGGPAVLANMAIDRWVPVLFSNISSRLVKQNGILFFGLGALLIVALFDGHVDILVVLYSTSVFLTFSLSILGLVLHWFRHRKEAPHWIWRFFLSVLGFLVCTIILVVTTLSKFNHGGWVTILVIALMVWAFLIIRRYYRRVFVLMKHQEVILKSALPKSVEKQDELDPTLPTAIIILDEYPALGLHTLLHLNRLFPKKYKNVVFLFAGVVDVKSLGAEEELNRLRIKTEHSLKSFIGYANSLGLRATGLSDYGTNATQVLIDLIEKIR